MARLILPDLRTLMASHVQELGMKIDSAGLMTGNSISMTLSSSLLTKDLTHLIIVYLIRTQIQRLSWTSLRLQKKIQCLQLVQSERSSSKSLTQTSIIPCSALMLIIHGFNHPITFLSDTRMTQLSEVPFHQETWLSSAC